MSSYCVSTILSPEQKEIATAIWYSLGMQWCEEKSVNNGVEIKVYFKDQNSAQIASEDLKNRNPFSPVQIKQVENEDWNRKWRESMQPAELASGYWVSPLWLPPPMKETGSGILCFVADKCKAARCTGVEIDKDCQENLAENHRLNPPEGRIDFFIGTLSALKNSAKFDLVVMNMIIKESEPLLSSISQLLKNEGILVWSGILNNEKEEAITSASDFNFKLIEQKTENEWWCGSFIR